MEDGKLEIAAASQMDLPFEGNPQEVPSLDQTNEVRTSEADFEEEISSWTYDPDFMAAVRELGSDCGMEGRDTLDFMQDLLILMRVFGMSRSDVLGSVTRTRAVLDETGRWPSAPVKQEKEVDSFALNDACETLDEAGMDVTPLSVEEILELANRLNGTFTEDYS